MIDILSHRLTNSAASRLKHFADLADKRALELELDRLKIRGATEIPTWTTRTQLETLYRLAAGLPAGAKVVEFGSYLGASKCFLAAGVAAGNGRVIAIDLWNNETIPDEARDTFADRVVDAVVAALLSRLIVSLASALVVFARAAPALEVDFDLLFFIAGFALGI